ncbi:MAG TPA: retropepsin-like aspartic protease, partial [Candidatus Eremiobacteraceae bacterium]
MIAAILAVAIHSLPAVVLDSAPGAPSSRYVRLHMTVDGYGMGGSATLLVDREQARYVEHFDLGPQSFYQGFDGLRAWQADANGTTAQQGNSLDRATVRAWGDLFAFKRPADAPGRVATDPATGRIARFSMWNGNAEEVATFSQYQTFSGGTIAPRSITFTDDNGTWRGSVTSIETPSDITVSAFAPPPAPRDASIAGGQTSVSFLTATEIIIPVRIDDGPVMHFILDTGGQNVLTTASVKRLGLHTIGHGTVGGAGAGVIPTAFLTVRSVRIGGAEMRDQPFIVIDSSVLGGIDGIVGFELLSRFAARIDYRTNTLTLASSLPQTWVEGVEPTPFVFRSRAPQIEGSIDAFPGSLVVDTGNSGVLDVNAPFAKAHDLWTYYHAA